MQTPLTDWASVAKLITEQGRFAGPKEMGRRFAKMEQRIEESLVRESLLAPTTTGIPSRGSAPTSIHPCACRTDGVLTRDELLATLAVLRHAVRRGQAMLALHNGCDIRQTCRDLAEDMRAIISRHQALWLARNRRGGLASSTAYYRKNLREYQMAARV
jgi:hypothetical protein